MLLIDKEKKRVKIKINLDIILKALCIFLWEGYFMNLFKKRDIFYYFPIFSIISLLLIRAIESSYPTREPRLFYEYLYINMLIPTFYFFFVAYLIPLVIVLDLKKKVSLTLKILSIVMYIVLVAVSLYSFYIRKQPDLLPHNVDVFLGVLGGSILGFSLTSYK